MLNTCVFPILVIIIDSVIFNGCTAAITVSDMGVRGRRIIHKTISLIEFRIDIVIIVIVYGVIGICGGICDAGVDGGGMIIMMMAMGLGRWYV